MRGTTRVSLVLIGAGVVLLPIAAASSATAVATTEQLYAAPYFGGELHRFDRDATPVSDTVVSTTVTEEAASGDFDPTTGTSWMLHGSFSSGICSLQSVDLDTGVVGDERSVNFPSPLINDFCGGFDIDATGTGWLTAIVEYPPADPEQNLQDVATVLFRIDLDAAGSSFDAVPVARVTFDPADVGSRAQIVDIASGSDGTLYATIDGSVYTLPTPDAASFESVIIPQLAVADLPFGDVDFDENGVLWGTTTGGISSYAFGADAPTLEIADPSFDVSALFFAPGTPGTPPSTSTSTSTATPPAPTEPAAPAVSLGSGIVVAGASLTIDGSGFAAASSVRIELHSTPIVLTTATTDGSGRLSVTTTIPASTPQGVHTIVVYDAESGAQLAAATVTVQSSTEASTQASSSQSLAATGSPAGGLVAVAVSLLSVGALVFAIGASRRPVAGRG